MSTTLEGGATDPERERLQKRIDDLEVAARGQEEKQKLAGFVVPGTLPPASSLEQQFDSSIDLSLTFYPTGASIPLVIKKFLIVASFYLATVVAACLVAVYSYPVASHFRISGIVIAEATIIGALVSGSKWLKDRSGTSVTIAAEKVVVASDPESVTRRRGLRYGKYDVDPLTGEFVLKESWPKEEQTPGK